MAVEMLPDAQVNKIVAHLPAVRQAVRAAADKIKVKAEIRLEPHHTPARESSISVTYGTVDAFVNLDDEAARNIEFGHFHNFSGKWVEGLYIVRGAAGLL